MLPETKERLIQAGWFPGRRIDDVQLVEWLKIGVNDFGSHLFPEAIRVLQEYGGLVLTTLHFSPEECPSRGDKLEWLLWERQVKEVLFPIAYTLDDIYTYAISPSGKVYADGIGTLFCENSFEEFLDKLFVSQSKQIQWQEIVWDSADGDEFEGIYSAVLSDDTQT